MTPTIRPETAADHEAVRRVNRLAFGRGDEAEIVDALREGGYTRLSLVAEEAGEVIGHLLFSELPIHTAGGVVPAVSLAPMAVLPEFQGRGVGSALVREGLAACRGQGHRIALVLGHPYFYPRFGFSAKLAEPLTSPFGGGEAWMAAELVPGALAGVSGEVQYPPPFGVAKRRPGQLTLLGVPGEFAVCKLPPGAPLPAWPTAGEFFSVTRTPDELSVVCPEGSVPDGVTCERGWRGVRVAGAMPFTAVGVLAALTAPVAAAGVSLFAVSTFDTDYILVKEADFPRAVAAWRTTGHEVQL